MLSSSIRRVSCALRPAQPLQENVFGLLQRDEGGIRSGAETCLQLRLESQRDPDEILRSLTLASSFVLALTVPALAGVTVNSPVNNTDVPSPFTLSASAATCSSQSVVTMGYSFDSSASATVFNGQSINKASFVFHRDAHLHVKAWGPNGASCVTSVVITVKAGSAGPESVIPSSADVVSHIQALSGWAKAHDTGGPGSSSGSTALSVRLRSMGTREPLLPRSPTAETNDIPSRSQMTSTPRTSSMTPGYISPVRPVKSAISNLT